jgi:hypothetical protein
MTRKDYIALAEVIAGEVATGNMWQKMTSSNIARSMADVFKRDNERFNRETFYKACGLGPTGGLGV